MNRTLRYGLIGAAAVIVVAAGVGAVVVSQFDPNSFKPQIIAAVKRATGRDLALNGKIRLEFALSPTVRIEDVTFANPPGYSRPQMATLQSLEVEIGLLPLLSGRVELERLVLGHPDILLETNQTGQPNWQLSAEVSPAAPAGSQAQATGPGKAKTDVSIQSIRIEQGIVAYRDDQTGKTISVALPSLDAKAASLDAPMHIDATATYNDTGITLRADTGSLSRLQDPAATTPWPVKLALAADGAKVTADGTLTQPMVGKGYKLAVTGSVPDVSALAPLLPGTTLPPLHDVNFAAHLADNGTRIPDVSALTLHLGAADLNAQVAGLTLDHLDIDASAQPVKTTGAATLGTTPVTLAGTIGPLGNTIPLALVLQVADEPVSLKGTLTQPGPSGTALHGFTLNSPDGDLSGDITVGLIPRVAVTATLTSTRLDIDALQAAFSRLSPGAPPQAGAETPDTAAAVRQGKKPFSDRPIPLGGLRDADADVTLSVAALQASDTTIKGLDAHLVLKDGKLRVDPFAADLPGGHATGSLTLDATPAAPPVHLVLHAPGVAVKTLLAVAHQPPYATGNLEIYADLSGAGDTPHAIAGSLDGSLGLAMAGGTLDNRLLGSLLGKVMDSLNALDLVGKGGTSAVSCFAVKAEVRHGIATIRPLALKSSLLTMGGDGTVNLATETLALQLRPQARVAGTSLVIPMNVSGPINDPAVRVNRLGAAEDNAGTVAGAVLGSMTPLGIVGGLLGGDKLLEGNGDICPAALAIARGQTVPADAGRSESKPINGAETLLKNLFR